MVNTVHKAQSLPEDDRITEAKALGKQFGHGPIDGRYIFMASDIADLMDHRINYELELLKSLINQLEKIEAKDHQGHLVTMNYHYVKAIKYLANRGLKS